MTAVKTVHMTMPEPRDVFKGVAHNFDMSMIPKEHAIKVAAYTHNRDIIDSGTPTDVHIAGHGVVSFRFTPSEAYPQAGASRGVFVPFKEAGK